MGAYLVGVDIGTQGVKAGLFDGLSGKCLAAAFRASRLHRPRPHVVEEEPEFQVRGVCGVIARCVREARIDRRSVAAVGIAGQMAGIIGVDAGGRAVTPYDSWLDVRCAPYIAVMSQEAGSEVVEKTGGPPSFNHGPKILWWMHERKREFRRIRCFVQPGGYAAMRLCGLSASDAFIDHTYLHFSGFADNRARRWDPDLCERFGLDPGVLPRIVAPQETIGGVTAAMARRCGLVAGTPVVAGCGDTAASFLACGATREGVCVDVAGTASVFAATTRTFRADTAHRVLSWGRSAVPGLWHPYAYINGGGMNLEWFRSQIANRMMRGRSDASPTRHSLGDGAWTFDRLNRLAASVRPSIDDPLFIPHLAGRVSPAQPALRGAWIGLAWNHTAAHLHRALLEGVALEYAIYLKTLRALHRGFRPREVRVTGGGAQSAVWNRIKADVLGIPVVKVSRSEGAPLGSALLAGFGAGLFSDLAQAARRWIGTGGAVRPDRKLSGVYAARLARYERCIAMLNRLLEEA